VAVIAVGCWAAGAAVADPTAAGPGTAEVPRTGTSAPTAYVVNSTGTVTPVDTATHTPGTPIPVAGGAQEIAITP
jgi:hypothetical protein